MEEFVIPGGELTDWLSILKKYQRSTIDVFLKESSPEGAAEKWLSSTASSNIANFGGEPNAKPFWHSFKAEFDKFICNDDAYAKEKKTLFGNPTSKELLLATISSAIGSQLGLAASLLAPSVLLLLYTAGKIGKNAYCVSRKVHE